MAQPGTALAEYRILRPDGEIRTIYEVTEIVGDVADGQPLLAGHGPGRDGNQAGRSRSRRERSALSRFRRRCLPVPVGAGRELPDRHLLRPALRARCRVEQQRDPRPDLPRADRCQCRHQRERLGGVRGAAGNAHQPFQDFPYVARLESGHTEYRRASGRPIFDASGIFKGYRGRHPR